MEFKASLGGGSKAGGGGGGGEEGWNGGKGRTAEGNSIRRYERCEEGERGRGNGVIVAKKLVLWVVVMRRKWCYWWW